MAAIVLHQWSISPFCGKVRRILEHKGLAYEIVNYNGFRARKASGLSSAGKLPVLDYDGERIQDSSDIAAFLEARHPEQPIFPADPELRARAHFWEDWADESLFWFEAHQRFMYREARLEAAKALTEGRSSLASSRSVTQTQEVISTLEETLGLVESAETSQRAYVITGQTGYVRDSLADRPKIEENLAAGSTSGGLTDLRWLLASATVATLVGAVLIPTVQRLLSISVDAFGRRRSVLAVLRRAASPAVLAHVREAAVLPRCTRATCGRTFA